MVNCVIVVNCVSRCTSVINSVNHNLNKKKRVCWLHLNSQSSACDNYFSNITSRLFALVLALLINLKTYAMTFLAFLNVEHDFIKCSMIGFSTACVGPTGS